MMTRTGSFIMVTMNIDNAGPKAVSAQPVNSSNVIANWRQSKVPPSAAGKLIEKRQHQTTSTHSLTKPNNDNYL